MIQFTDEQLKAYASAVFAASGLEIAFADGPVRQHRHTLEFEGRLAGTGEDETFVMSIGNSLPGVFTARSVIAGKDAASMTTDDHGRADRNCRDILVVDVSSHDVLSLHPSVAMLRAAEDGRDVEPFLSSGRYAEDVCIGRYDKVSGNPVYRLVPVVGPEARMARR